MEFIDRKTALEKGLKLYRSKTTRINKHKYPDRYSPNGTCVLCCSIKEKSEHTKNRKKDYNARNAESIRIHKKEYRERTKDRYKTEEYKLKRAEYRVRYLHKAKKDKSEWISKNRGKVNASNSLRYAIKKQRTPSWADIQKIEEFYILANSLTISTGIKHHVDHIVPLQGVLVSGLHVEYNLRVIPARDNLSKSNKFIEELLTV